MSETEPATQDEREPGDAAPSSGDGEDEGSTSNEGKDDHLKEDQKPTFK